MDFFDELEYSEYRLLPVFGIFFPWLQHTGQVQPKGSGFVPHWMPVSSS